uniref:Uncharacterized protein n=1 Tax=Arundo donax TaxID=35708 RepID=A0A0A9EXS2_ARUDO
MIVLPITSSFPGATLSSTLKIRCSSNGSAATNIKSSFHIGFRVRLGDTRVLSAWLPSMALT